MGEKVKSLLKKSRNNPDRIVEEVRAGEASEFYFACRNGDITKVKEMLPTISYDKLNKLESNGSTALHAATCFDHIDIVRLLLHEYHCQRNIKNLYGLTAYEEAKTDEMRQLFHRPSNVNRFSDDDSITNEQTFKIVSSSLNENEIDDSDNDDDDDYDDNSNDVEKPDTKYLSGYETSEEVKRYVDGLSGAKAFFRSRFGRYIMKKGMKFKVGKDSGYTDEEYAYVSSKKFRRDALQKILDEHVTSNHPAYQCCYQLLNDYIEHGRIESLLTLYTLETPFYQQLFVLSSPLGFPFFMHLSDLKYRYYQGYSYRGVHLTQRELNEYRWSLKNKDSILSPFTFASTSIDRDVAEIFSEKCSSASSNKISVLLILHFPQSCDTAINLSQISEYKLPCISFFENEKEVLVGPRTLFKVTKIQTNKRKQRYTIYLENLCGQQQTVFGAIKFFIRDDFKNKTNKKL